MIFNALLLKVKAWIDRADAHRIARREEQRKRYCSLCETKLLPSERVLSGYCSACWLVEDVPSVRPLGMKGAKR